MATITATDLDMVVTFTTEATTKTTKPLALLFPAHNLKALIQRSLPGDFILGKGGKESDGAPTVSAGSTHTVFRGAMSAVDFPGFETGNRIGSFKIKATDLRQVINDVWPSISDETTRYYLNGVHIAGLADSEEPRIKFTATDGHKLARVSLPIHHNGQKTYGENGAIVPTKMLKVIHAIWGDEEGKLTVTFWKGRDSNALHAAYISVAAKHVTVTSRVIDGTFPDADRVIPNVKDRVPLTFAPEKVARAIGSLLPKPHRGSSDAMLFDVDLAARKIVVSNDYHGEGDSMSSVDACISGGSEFKKRAQPAGADGPCFGGIGINRSYLLSSLKFADGDEAEMFFQDKSSPMVIRRKGDVHRFMVLMPMRY